jgi:hypothetical protein
MVVENVSCCRISKIEDDIVELVFAEGVEIVPADIDAIHRWLDENLPVPYMIVINKVNQYSYSFEAQLKLGQPEAMKAIAIVSHSAISTATQDHIQGIHALNPLNLQVFSCVEEALPWLHEQRALVS